MITNSKQQKTLTKKINKLLKNARTQKPRKENLKEKLIFLMMQKIKIALSPFKEIVDTVSTLEKVSKNIKNKKASCKMITEASFHH